MNAHFIHSPRSILLSSALAAAACMLCASASADRLPNERPTRVNGILAACTGTGSSSRLQAQQTNYPVRFEFVGGYGQYLGDETVTVEDRKANAMVSVSCNSPWVMMQLPPGRYQVTAEVPGAPTKTRWVTVGNGGRQEAVYFRYPGMTAGAPRSSSYASNEALNAQPPMNGTQQEPAAQPPVENGDRNNPSQSPEDANPTPQ